MEFKNGEKNILTGYNMLLYFAGTVIMYEPSDECIIDFWTNGILKNLPVSSANPTFIKAASQLRNSCADKNVCKEKLQEDFIRLFGKLDISLAPAIESIYKTEFPNTRGTQKLTVTDFYNSYGWKSKFKAKINDDHLSIELLFLTRLIDKYLLMDDHACQVEMRNEICRFIVNHLFSWIGEWNKKVQANSLTDDFKGVANLVVACTEDIYSVFSKNHDGHNN